MQHQHHFSSYRHFALALLLASMLAAGGQAIALPTTLAANEDARVVPEVNGDVYRKLMRVQRDIDRGKFEKAEAKLRKLLESTALNGNETAKATHMLAFVFFKTDRWAEATVHFRQVLNHRNSIAEEFELAVLKTLAELAFKAQEFDRTLFYADQWRSLSDETSAEVLALMAMANYELKQSAAAIMFMTKAIDIELAAEREPNKNWIDLIAYLNYERNDWTNFVHYQEICVKRYPTKKGGEILAKAYAKLNQFEAARMAQKRAARLEIESP